MFIKLTTTDGTVRIVNTDYITCITKSKSTAHNQVTYVLFNPVGESMTVDQLTGFKIESILKHSGTQQLWYAMSSDSPVAGPEQSRY